MRIKNTKFFPASFRTNPIYMIDIVQFIGERKQASTRNIAKKFKISQKSASSRVFNYMKLGIIKRFLPSPRPNKFKPYYIYFLSDWGKKYLKDKLEVKI